MKELRLGAGFKKNQNPILMDYVTLGSIGNNPMALWFLRLPQQEN